MKTKKKVKRSPIKLYSLLLFLFVLLISIGSGLQFLAEYLDQLNNPPPGRMVKMGDYFMHIHCSGKGSPTVILESDLAYSSLQWAIIQRDLSKQTQVCSYDRAALGWSETSPFPRKGQEMNSELFRLLRKTNVEGPYILVGYNRGAWLTRLFAYHYPEDVAALVLIAPYPEDMDSQIPPQYRIDQVWSPFVYRMMTPITWLGITRLYTTLGGMDLYTAPYINVSQDIRQKTLAMTIFRTNYWMPAAVELDATQVILSEVAQKKNLTKIPLWILAIPTVHLKESVENLPLPILTTYNQMQNELAQLSSKGAIVKCDICGSMPPVTAPNQVKAIIQQALRLSVP